MITTVIFGACAVLLLGAIVSVAQRDARRGLSVPLKIAFAIILVGLVVAGLVSWSRHGEQVPEPVHRQRVVAVRALDDGGAIVQWDRGDASWLARYDGDRVRWKREIATPDSSNLSVGSDFVLVVSLQRPIQLALVDIETGADRWSTTLKENAVQDVVVGTASVFLDAGEKWLEISVGSGKLVREIAAMTAEVDRARGVVSAVPQFTDEHWKELCRCASGAKSFEFGFDPSAEHDAGRMRVVEESGSKIVPIEFVAKTCGNYQDSLVVMTTGTDERLRMLRLNREGEVVRDVLLVEGRNVSAFVGSHQVQPLSGQVPRFVPVQTMRRAGATDYEYKNVVIDLETGAITPSAFTASGNDPLAKQRGDVDPPWLLHRTSWIRSLRNELEVLDGSTGRSRGAFVLNFQPFRRRFDVDLRQAAGGKLWLHDEDADAIALVRVDLGSMKPEILIGPVEVSIRD